MKKIINLFICLISIITFVTIYNITDVNERNKLLYKEETEKSFKIEISNEVTKMDNEIIYEIMKSVLDEYEGSIYNTSYSSVEDVIEKYIYITKSNYLDTFRFQDKIIEFKGLNNNKFIATYNSNEENQIGKILDFSGNDKVKFYSIQNLKNFSGIYQVQLDDLGKKEDFIIKLENELGVPVIESYVDISGVKLDFTGFYIIGVLYIIVIILILYNILNEYKKIGIKKLMGYSDKRIWIESVIKIILKLVLILSIISIIGVFILAKDINFMMIEFIGKMIGISIIQGIISFLIFSIPFIFLKEAKVSEIIKNKKPVRLIITTNNIVRIVLIILSLNIGINLYEKYSYNRTLYNENYLKWEETKNYAVLSTLYKTPDDDSMFEVQAKIYKEFNKKQAVLAKFDRYIPELEKLNSHISENEKFAQVNPNYLKVNEIYDSIGNKIEISEKEEELVILVPERYRESFEEIEYYAYDTIKPYIGKEDNKDIKFIWTKDNQELFTYNPDINPLDGNVVIDPIVVVITENNGGEWGYLNVINIGGDPFKIKIDDPSDPYKTINPILEKYDLCDPDNVIYNLYDEVSYYVKQVEDEMRYYLFALIGVMLVLALIIVENVLNFYEQNKYRLTVKKLHGYSNFNKYFEYYSWVTLTWIICLCTVPVIVEFDISLILVGVKVVAVLIVFELLLSFIAFYKVERQNILKWLKGGE